MKITTNHSLKPYNTFGIDVMAKQFIALQHRNDFKKVLQEHQDFFMIGGGSNILLLNDIEKPVVHINTKGKSVIGENRKYVFVKVAAGENWHDFVLWCLKKDFGGIENLAKIPGNVGASPIQNIGAYGVEVKDVIDEVHTIEIATAKERIFTKSQCNFGYRDSIFKNKHKGKFIITAVIFKLTQKNHTINDSYGAIEATLKTLNIENPSIQDVAETVIKIRTAKLPDPKEIGNSGSFFKNPIVSKEQFEVLQKEYLNIPSYPIYKKNKNFDDIFHTEPSEILNTELIKLAAGWLIDQCGLKGKRIGDAGVHEDQALVLVNYGKATGQGILALAKIIQQKVIDKFGVELEMEVNII